MCAYVEEGCDDDTLSGEYVARPYTKLPYPLPATKPDPNQPNPKYVHSTCQPYEAACHPVPVALLSRLPLTS